MDSKTSQDPALTKGEPQDPPPTYSDATNQLAPATTVLPTYEFASSRYQPVQVASSSQAKPNAITPYRPFPATISGHGTWSLAGFKSFHLTGADSKDRLYIVEANFKHKVGGPLKDVPGLLLRNGVNVKDPVLAATADNNPDPTIRELVLMDGYVLLPTAGGSFRMEPVHTEVSEAGELVLQFGVDQSDGSKNSQEEFEWVKFEKGSEREYPAGGYRLFRKDDGKRASGSGAGGSSGANVSRGDALAILSWPGNLLMSGTHYFDLKFSKAVEGEGLGEQWMLMVVMTVLRIMFLRMSGRTKADYIKYWRKDGGRSSS